MRSGVLEIGPLPNAKKVVALLLIIFPFLAAAMTPRWSDANQAPVSHVAAQHIRVEGIPNFGKVTPMLYRGGEPSEAGLKTLARMGVSIVIDAGYSTRDENLIRTSGMTYVSIPWHCPFPKDAIFARFLKIVRENQGKRIFVHCRLGDDRTGMLIASYRMSEQGWSADEALREMQDFGFTGLHHVLCPGLEGYEQSFPQRLRNDPEFKVR